MLISIKSIKSYTKQKLQKSCTKKVYQKRFPILGWLPNYTIDWAVGDLIAGITVALTVIPQGLAYSNIIRVPTQNGLYSSFIGCLVYIVLGSCKDVSVGPTATLALVSYQAIGDRGLNHAILLCLISGTVQIAMGLLGLGFLIDFISGPVSAGFTSAVALCIVASQLKYIFSVPLTGTTFIEMCQSLIQNTHLISWQSTFLGTGCIIVLLLLRSTQNIRFGQSEDNQFSKGSYLLINKTFWLIGIARNAVVVVVCTFISYNFYQHDGSLPFSVIGDVPAGLPEIKPPPFEYSESKNGTEIHYGFLDMLKDFGSGLIAVPLVCLLENIAICKAFANGKAVDATQELLAIGVANVANSFVQGIPITGALARSALNNSSGVRTTLGGLYTAALVITSLLFFAPYFYFIPEASLAAVIIAAVIFMIEYHVVKPIWKTNKSDLVPGLSTFVACLVLPLQYGVLVGMGVNIMFILYHIARPKVLVEKLATQMGAEYLKLTPDRCLVFPSVDYVKNQVNKHSLREGMPVVIDCTFIYKADFTAGTAIRTLVEDFVARRQPLLFYNLKPSVNLVFEGLSSKHFLVYYSEEELDNILMKEMDTNKQQAITKL